MKLDYQSMEQHSGGAWLIHGTKFHKDSQWQSPELPRLECPSLEYKFDRKCFKNYIKWEYVKSNILKQSPGAKTSFGCMELQNQNHIVWEGLNLYVVQMINNGHRFDWICLATTLVFITY